MQKQNENSQTVTYKIIFIDSVRFMASLLSSLTDHDNLTTGLHKD